MRLRPVCLPPNNAVPTSCDTSVTAANATRRAISSARSTRTSELAGSPKGSPGGGAPNLTPDPDRGIGRWSLADLEFFLELGMKPDGDFAGGGMAPVVDENTAQLTKEDRAAIAAFLRSLPPG